jgi:hypothetical protein
MLANRGVALATARVIITGGRAYAGGDAVCK